MYGKIFESIYDGTLAEDWRALVTFQQLIVLCDRDGIIDMTPAVISRRTGIPIEHIKAGLEILEKEDPYSRTPDEGGRRIIRLDEHRPWGWRIVNHGYYRDLASRQDAREKAAERQRRKRENDRQGADSEGVSRVVTPGHGESRESRHARSSMHDADAKKGASKLPSWLPEDAWKEFVAFRQKKAPLTDRAKKLAITELDKLRQEGHDPAEVIDQSILNGWRGLFPLKKGETEDEDEVPFE